MNKTINPPVEQSADLETSLSAPAIPVAQGSGPGEENKTCPPAQPPGPETQNPGSLSYEGLSLPEDISCLSIPPIQDRDIQDRICVLR